VLPGDQHPARRVQVAAENRQTQVTVHADFRSVSSRFISVPRTRQPAASSTTRI
jgi:hypothetical protein